MKGGCFCGKVRYEVARPAGRMTNCHCLHCRRTSGAPFLTWFEVKVSDFRIVAGAPAACATRPGVTRLFCPQCGTQLTFQDADEPGSLDVTACSLDEVDGILPEDHVWSERMVPWLKLADGLPRFARSRYDA